VPGLDEAALECVGKWRFKPARKNGKPVPTVVRARVEFTTHPGPNARPAELLESLQASISAPSRPIAELEAALGSVNTDERARATWELAGTRPVSTALLDRVRELTRRDPDDGVRQAAAWAYNHLEAASDITGPTRAFDEPPTVLRSTRPSLPKDARARRRGGEVVVEVLISESGEVVRAEIRQSVEGLDEPALECARSWLFAPARAEGRPVASVALVSVSFRAYE